MAAGGARVGSRVVVGASVGASRSADLLAAEKVGLGISRGMGLSIGNGAEFRQGVLTLSCIARARRASSRRNAPSSSVRNSEAPSSTSGLGTVPLTVPGGGETVSPAPDGGRPIGGGHRGSTAAGQPIPPTAGRVEVVQRARAVARHVLVSASCYIFGNGTDPKIYAQGRKASKVRTQLQTKRVAKRETSKR